MKYNQKPSIKISDDYKMHNELEIFNELKKHSRILIEVYPGIDVKKIRDIFSENLNLYKIIEFDENYISKKVINQVITGIGTDRIFAKMNKYDIDQFYTSKNIEEARKLLAESNNIILIGVGVSMLKDEDCLLIHMSLPRWEIQKNYRQGMSNWQQQNSDMENTQKFKFGYFFDWRIGDSIKVNNADKIDFFIDCTNYEMTMLSNGDYKLIINEIVKQPFRLTPFFDPGVWGGQWMKNKFGLNPIELNYAWSFDGVPEENSVHVEGNNIKFEIPGIDLVLFEPINLLGDIVYEKYGAEFPIRFDMLDTIGGQNLSLQVHPHSEYMLQNFGLNYTQEESYYILDTSDDNAVIYIGLKDGITSEKFFTDLEISYRQNSRFDVDQYVNKVPCKKGDHFLIPAGTIHCSGKDVMVLEISQTPYIFTFKLWDWNRVDLNGLPRPINLEHGKRVLNENYNSSYVRSKLYNKFEPVNEYVTLTGLAESQDVVTQIYEHSDQMAFKSNGKFQMINLVDGDSLEIYSESKNFKKFTLNEFETVILPASLGRYCIKSTNGRKVKYVKAEVR